MNIPNGYTAVLDDNFVADPQLDSSLWPIQWGNPSDISFGGDGVTLTSYSSEGWAPIGFAQADYGAGYGQGYGLYSVTMSMNAGESNGPAVIMWPANNQWPGAEIDIVEDWNDPSRQTGYATIHWSGGGFDQYDAHAFHVDMTQQHTYSWDWEPNSLSYFIDGTQLFQVTGAEVPLDAADGGSNETLGVEVTGGQYSTTSSSVSIHVSEIGYAVPQPVVVALSPAPRPVAVGSSGVTEITGHPATVQAVPGLDLDGFQSGVDKVALPAGDDPAGIVAQPGWDWGAASPAWGTQVTYDGSGDSFFVRWAWQFLQSDVVSGGAAAPAASAGNSFIAQGGLTLIDNWNAQSELLLPAGTDPSAVQIAPDWDYSSLEGPSWGERVNYGGAGASAFLRWTSSVDPAHIAVAAS